MEKQTALTTAQVKKIGGFDSKNRFVISPFFVTETSRNVRSPSRAYPYSEWRHAHTAKYFKSLSDEQKSVIFGE